MKFLFHDVTLIELTLKVRISPENSVDTNLFIKQYSWIYIKILIK